MNTSKRKHERVRPKAIDESHPNTTWIKWIGDREDLGLTKGEKYTYTALGKACGVAPSSMRGRLNGVEEADDCHMWKKGERKPRSEWGIAKIMRCESRADRMSQKYLRMSL